MVPAIRVGDDMAAKLPGMLTDPKDMYQAQSTGAASVAPGASSPTNAGGGIASALTSATTPSGSTNSANDGDIARRVAAITSKDSALMRTARTSGLQQANRRGVMNSSMGIGAAESAALGVAAPIASQESQQDMQERLNQANLAAAERERILAAQVQAQGNYSSALAQTLTNDKIPAAARDSVQRSLRDQLYSNVSFIEDLYGVNLAFNGTAPSAPAASYGGGGIGSAYGQFY
jgi:hypothetical protein